MLRVFGFLALAMAANALFAKFTPEHLPPCAMPPKLVPVPDTLPADTVKALAAVESKLRDGFLSLQATGGVVTVVLDGKQILTVPFGTLTQGGANVTGDTMFRIASNTKVFTAAMLLQLRDAGKVSLDAQVTSVEPAYKPQPHPGVKTSRGATFADLASHTAGLPRDFDNLTVSYAEALAALQTYTLIHPPGRVVAYSNAGFAMLGRILEKVAGMSWEDYVPANILKPLGMTNSATTTPQDLSNVAIGYSDGQPLPQDSLGIEAPAGSIYASGNDMAKWLALWCRDDEPYNPAAGQILDGDTIGEWTTRRAWATPSALNPTVSSIAYSDFGFPFEIVNVQNTDPAMAEFASYNLVTKGGDLTGYHSQSAVVPALKLGVFGAMTTGGLPDAVSGLIHDLILNVTAFDIVPLVYKLYRELSPDQNPPLPPNPEDYIGLYTLPEVPVTAFNASIFMNGTALYLTAAQTGYVNQQLKWLGGDLLQMNGLPFGSACTNTQWNGNSYMMQFQRNSTGGVASVAVQGFGITLEKVA